MHTYHFGSWSDRFDPGWWSTIYRTVTTHVAPLPTLTIVLVLGCWAFSAEMGSSPR